MFRARCEGGAEFAIKLFKAAHHDVAAREKAVFSELERRADLPVPRLLHAGDEALVLTVVPGESMGGMLGWMDRADFNTVYRQLGVFLGRLHGARPARFGGLPDSGLPSFASNREFMAVRFEWALSRYREYGGPVEIADAAEQYVGHRAGLFDACERPAVVHFDLHPQNVLLRREGDRALRLTGVVDWESGLGADPLADIAQAWHMSPHRAPEHLTSIVEGYGGIEGEWRPRLDLYVLYFSIELWIWFVKGGSPPPHEGIDARIAGIVGG